MRVTLTLPNADNESVEALRGEIAKARIPLVEPDPMVLKSPQLGEFIMMLGSAGALTALTTIVQAFLSRHSSKEIKIETIDQGTITIKGSSASEVGRLLKSFFNRGKAKR